MSNRSRYWRHALWAALGGTLAIAATAAIAQVAAPTSPQRRQIAQRLPCGRVTTAMCMDFIKKSAMVAFMQSEFVA